MFLGNPEADAATELTPEAGYAGSIHVYGYGGRSPRLLTRTLVAGEDAVRAARGSRAVTLVPVGYGAAPADVDLAGADVGLGFACG